MDTNGSSKFFIPAGVNLEKDHDEMSHFANMTAEKLIDRWNTAEGKMILATWKENNFKREVLEQLIGKYYNHTDIRGVPLKNENIRDVDLSCVDLFRANLEKTIFHCVDFSDSWLSETNIKGTKFEWSAMDKALVDNTLFDHGTRFTGVNINVINFTLAALLQDLVIGQQRIVHLERRHPILSRFLKITCDYGRSFTRFFAWSILIMIAFGFIYNFVSGSITENGLWSSMYFSVVTFTTLGYGDIYPVSALGRILVIMEVVLGYIMAGLLVAILSRRIIGQ